MRITGFDLFVQDQKVPKIPTLGPKITHKQVANRGTPIWPGECPPIECTDMQRCRFFANEGHSLSFEEVSEALLAISKSGVKWSMLHLLFAEDDKNLFSG